MQFSWVLLNVYRHRSKKSTFGPILNSEFSIIFYDDIIISSKIVGGQWRMDLFVAVKSNHRKAFSLFRCGQIFEFCQICHKSL